VTLRKQSLLGVVVVALLAIIGPIAMAQTAQEKKNQEIVLSWHHDVIILGHVDQASKYMADDYIEHDPRIAGGKAGFIRYYGNALARHPEADKYAVFAQGDYVVIVWQRADTDPKTSTPYSYATTDVVRVKNGKILEHWDNAKMQSQW